jgi:alpha-L-fucosidase
MVAAFNKIVMMFLVMFCIVAASFAAEDNALVNDPLRSQEFMNWGLGMFIHWSFDSQLGSVISHSMVGASEEYLDRYINDLPKTFNPDQYDPEKWMQIAHLAGVKYLVLTTKHHNGFCMWDSKTTGFNIMNTPYGKDIVRKYVVACRKYGMKVGFYFSPEDFMFLHSQGKEIRRRAEHANISNNAELLAHNRAQIKELFTNYGDVDVVFLDAYDNYLIAQYIHELQPKCLITRGEMETPEQNIPDEPMPGPWEACYTMGTQWQFKPTNEDYKSGGRLIEMLIEIRAKGGNLLINAGPEPNGLLPFEQERRFRELGLWMFINHEAIYNIKSCPRIREGELWFTHSSEENAVYVFITHKDYWKLGERREFSIKSLRATEDTKISVLGQNDRVVEYQPGEHPLSRFMQRDDHVVISVVRAQRIYNDRKWPNPIVVKLENIEFVKE